MRGGNGPGGLGMELAAGSTAAASTPEGEGSDRPEAARSQAGERATAASSGRIEAQVVLPRQNRESHRPLLSVAMLRMVVALAAGGKSDCSRGNESLTIAACWIQPLAGRVATLSRGNPFATSRPVIRG